MVSSDVKMVNIEPKRDIREFFTFTGTVKHSYLGEVNLGVKVKYP